MAGLTAEQFRKLFPNANNEPITKALATGLNAVSTPMNEYRLPEGVPLLGGQSAADLTGLTGAQGVVQDFSRGNLQSGDMRMFDLLGLGSGVAPAARTAVKGGGLLGKEALRQMNEGTGLLSRLAPDPRQYMFVGEKGINNLGLTDVLNQANKMKSSNIPDEQIWKATAPMVAEKGVRGGGITYQFGGVPQLEIADDLAKVNPITNQDFNYYKLTDVLEHPDVYKAEPSLKSVAVSPEDIDYSYMNSRQGLIGVGTPHRTTTSYNDEFGNLIEQYNFQPDVIGHEVNHGIQREQNLPQGGNQATKDYVNQWFNLQKENYSPAFQRIEDEKSTLNNLYRTSQIQDFNRIINKPSYKPRDLYSRGDWYKYSDDIRRQLGVMPKKSGEARDSYIREAHKILFDKYKAEKGITQEQVDSVLSSNKKKSQTDYQIKKIWDKLEPDYALVREFGELKDKNYKINQLNPFQVYDRVTGEATSRLVQDRWNMTPKERGLLYPVPTLSETGKKINPDDLIDLYYE